MLCGSILRKRTRSLVWVFFSFHRLLLGILLSIRLGFNYLPERQADCLPRLGKAWVILVWSISILIWNYCIVSVYRAENHKMCSASGSWNVTPKKKKRHVGYWHRVANNLWTKHNFEFEIMIVFYNQKLPRIPDGWPSSSNGNQFSYYRLYLSSVWKHSHVELNYFSSTANCWLSVLLSPN